MFAKESGKTLKEMGIDSWSLRACRAAEREHALRNVHRSAMKVATSTHLPAKRRRLTDADEQGEPI